MDLRFDIYVKALAKGYQNDEGTEHTGRTALENLLNAFAEDALAPGIAVQHEPKREADKGSPDFKVKRLGMILGYVEVKEIGANLDKVLKSAQIAKYRTLSDNIIVTDYLQFIRIDAAGKVLDRQTLAFPSDLESRTLRIDKDKADAVARLLAAFFSSPPQGLQRAQQLAMALATRSKLLRDYLTEELLRQSKAKSEGRLHGLYAVFREQVFHELAVTEFADAFAQMLAYGLFLAKLNAADDQVIGLDNVRKFIPGSFRLIRELVRFLEEMQETQHDSSRWVVDEILSIVNGLNIASIRDDLSFRQRKPGKRRARAEDDEEQRLFDRDPFIYFYEDFLKAYDKDTRKGRGVYYTPPPVVNFIVRAVDDILKDTFQIAEGLADHRQVTVLDFAAGTGTFLLEVMQRIFENIGGAQSGKAGAVVREHMLKNLYGFEYLIAPYTIAHLKLSQYLKDRGHPLADSERLQVFLTNTLEPVTPQKSAFLPELSKEVEEAQKVKEKPILVILGNPPYSGHSKNKGTWITRAIDGYKYTIERKLISTSDTGEQTWSEEKKPLGEKNPKWLNDDYVKFIRFAQLKIDAVEEGIVGIITNHSWLDNPTFRGMRQSLMRSFDLIYVLDLHGNSKKKERAPDGSKDENVFDIEQGVAISIFVKKAGVERGVWRGDLWGGRLQKYQAAAANSLRDTAWGMLKPTAPHYLLMVQDTLVEAEYARGWSIPEILPVNVLGFQTHRDDFAISFTKSEMQRKLAELADLKTSSVDLAERYGLKSNRDWSFEHAREGARLDRILELQTITYRPFDNRWSEFSGLTIDYPRRELLAHVARRKNIVLGVGRFGNAVPERPWELVSVSEFPTDANIFRRGGINLFPLHVFEERKEENLSPDFRAFLDARYDHHYSPEEILGYIYAVLHSPAYRSRYAEFLRIDFPRVPFAESAEDFEALSKLGWALVQAHLLRSLPKRGLGDYHGKGANDVEHVRWSAEDRKVSINQTQGFAPIPQNVWEFHIGGYQVIDKYLKSRKGRTLSLDEINHVGRIADALAFTIDQMERINVVYAQAFPDRG